MPSAATCVIVHTVAIVLVIIFHGRLLSALTARSAEPGDAAGGAVAAGDAAAPTAYSRPVASMARPVPFRPSGVALAARPVQSTPVDGTKDACEEDPPREPLERPAYPPIQRDP